MERGQKLYIYAPDTFLKPILVLSQMQNECALCWVDALNAPHVIESGIGHLPHSKPWTILAEGKDNATRLFNKLSRELSGEDSWNTYFELWKAHCGREKAVTE